MKTWHDWRQVSSDPNPLIHPSGKFGTYEQQGAQEAKELLTLIPDITTKKTLDFGCGNGRLLRHLPSVYGVDIVADFVAEAQKYTDKAFLCDHLLDTDFDIVYSISVFIHLSDEDTKVALQYIHKRLKPGGEAYLQIPVYETHTSPRDFIDVRTWTVDTLLNLCEEVGFECDELWTNNGSFSYTDVGPNHHRLQRFVAIKP